MEKRLGEVYFNKDFDEINYNDVESFFLEEKEETSNLEYKTGDVTLEKLHREISAFLNTDGGLMIIGAPKEKEDHRTKRKSCQGVLTDCKNIKNEDTIYQSIAGNIIPTPLGIKIKQLSNDKNVIYLIDIPQSKNPPHQVSEKGVYYFRFEREAKAAPHGLVQALFQKRKKPQLNGLIETEINSELNYELTFLIQNNSYTPATKAHMLVLLHDVEIINSKDEFTESDDNTLQLIEKIGTHIGRRMTAIIKLIVKPKGKEFLVALGYWCKDQDYENIYAIIDTKNTEIRPGPLTNKIEDIYEEIRRYKARKNTYDKFQIIK